ncbi:hypothetical protein [Arthrobacter sp. SO3]|uniref:hypothetical protein n=1 Tax=Arthrobacter sp. SO3 TaxID=1897057 RepID=UPI001D000DE8|nr:hypothetical protein [Arthrobacter sp. SO3]
MKRNTIHSTLAAAALAGLLLTTGCAAPQATTAPQSSTTPSAAMPASTAPVLRVTATATPPVAPSDAAPAPEAPQAAVLETFTFPDGHVSFTHPSGWAVTVKPGPALNPEAQKTSFDATVFDASGSEVAHVLSGMYGDGAAGPVKRTVLDHTPVPGIIDKTGEATEAGFGYDELRDHPMGRITSWASGGPTNSCRPRATREPARCCCPTAF